MPGLSNKKQKEVRESDDFVTLDGGRDFAN